MLYRENGQFKTTYRADQQMLPILQDRFFVVALVAAAFLVVPLIASDYWFRALIVPFLILAIAAIGLNILVGYCGQISLGQAAFMSVGAYAAFNFTVRVPELNFLLVLLLSGTIAALAGMVFGLPSLRIRACTWQSPRWPRSFSSTGCSSASSGSPTIRPPARCRLRRSSCSAGPWTRRWTSTGSCSAWWW
jgi:hypothetical protein